MKNAVIIDAFSSRHIGNGILLDRSVCAIKKKFPEYNLRVISMDTVNVPSTYRPIKDIFSSFPKGRGFLSYSIWILRYITYLLLVMFNLPAFRSKYVETVLSADLIISISGETINSNFYYRMILRLLMLKAISLRKRVIIFPQSIGPIIPKHSSFVRFMMSKFDAIYARDTLSYDTSINQLGLKQTKFCPDVCCLYYTGSLDIKREENFTVGITISKTPREMIANYPLSEELFSQLKDLDKSRFKFLILPSNYENNKQSDDYKACNRICEKLLSAGFKVKILDDRVHTVDFFIKQLLLCDLVISSRMHVMILANTLLVPTIAINTQHKIRQYNILINNCHMVYEYDQIGTIRNFLSEMTAESINTQKIKLKKEIASQKKQFEDIMYCE